MNPAPEEHTQIPQDETVQDAAPETLAADTQPQEDAPETPAPEEQQPAWLQNLEAVTATMRAQTEMQRQEMEQRRANELQRQQIESRPVPLMERESWREEFQDVASRAGYDPQAARRMMEMQSELADERAEQRARQILGQELAPLRAEMQAGAYVAENARAAVRDGGGLITEQDFAQAADAVFGGNRVALAQALDPQNPNNAVIRQQISTYALGLAVQQGRLRPGSAPSVPANPRSAARPAPNTTPPAPALDANAELENLFAGKGATA